MSKMVNQKGFGNRNFLDRLASYWSRDRLLFAIVGTTVCLVSISGVVYWIWGSGPMLAVLPWFNPLGFVFMTLASISLAFLIRGRHQVLNDPFSYWVGIAFATNSVGLAFYVLAWPGLLPDGRSFIAHLPNTAGFLVTLSPTFLVGFILIALIARWPNKPPQLKRSLLGSMLAWCLFFVLLYSLIVAFEGDLPVMVRPDGTYSPVLLFWNVLNVVLFAFSVILAVRHYQRTGDALSAYIVFPLLAVIFANFYTLLGQERYDLWWYLARLVLIAGYLVMLFGLLSQYVQLFRQLRGSEARYRQLTESLPQLILTFRPDGLCTYMSPQWVAFTGIPEAQQLGAGWLEQVHPDDFQHTTETWTEAVAAGRSLDMEFRLRRHDGIYCWFQSLALPVRNDAGEITQWFGSCTDIDDRKRAEEELQAALAKAEAGSRMLDAILQYIPIGMTITGGPPDFPILQVSRHGLEINKGPEEDLLGMPSGQHQVVWNIFLPDGVTRPQPEQMPLYRASRFGEEIRSVELLMVSQNGRRIPVIVNAAPVRDARGNVVAAINAWLDISERKQAEEALAAYALDLQRSNRDLQEFAHMASHDLQEPLRKIETFSSLLLEMLHDTDEHPRDLMARMNNAANRMRSMVDGLLQLSQLETDAQPFQPVDLNQIAREVLSDLEMQIQRTDGTVELCELPWIEAEPEQMRRLLQNLIANGLKFQPSGGKPLVRVCTEPIVSQFVQISVEDNGIGFDEEHARHLFEPFKRLVGRSEYEGSGIGLAICRKIAERHNGRITAHSKPGQGSTFVVTLPVHQNLVKYPIRRA